MLSSDVQEIERPAKRLVGFSVRASLRQIIEQKLGNKLREQLTTRESEISHRIDAGMYLVQIYEYDAAGWTQDSPFTQVIGKEVTAFERVPDGMTTHTIPAGQYLRFRHEGPMRNIGATYDAMHKWLAQEQRGGRCPFDFEYWKDATRLEEADTEIGIHLPLRPDGRVGV